MNGPLHAKPEILVWILMVPLAILCAGFILWLPVWALSADLLRIAGFVAVVLLVAAATLIKIKVTTSRSALLTVGVTLWVVLLVTEEIFVRRGTIEAAARGEFPLAAYGEPIIWLMLGGALLLASLTNPRYLFRMFVGSNKWVTAFALICLVSVAYVPYKLFSLVWCAKLWLALLLLLFYFENVRKFSEVERFFRATFWAFACLSAIPLLQAFVDPNMLFSGGRLGGYFHGPVISQTAAIALLLHLSGYGLRRKGIWIAGALFFLILMVLGGGKTALLAAAVTIPPLLVFTHGLAFATGATATGIVFGGLIAFYIRPLLSYFLDYFERATYISLTGRTLLWEATLPEIRSHIFLGHGYLTSRFFGLTPTWEISWWQPTNLHNAYLEVLYNNGVVGLVPILLLNVIVVRNCLKVLSEKHCRKEARSLAFSLLALHAFLFINSLVSVVFGGRPHSMFLLFLALVFLSEKAKRLFAVVSITGRFPQKQFEDTRRALLAHDPFLRAVPSTFRNAIRLGLVAIARGKRLGLKTLRGYYFTQWTFRNYTS